MLTPNHFIFISYIFCIKKESYLKECINITKHYIKNASPGCGEIIKQEGYNESLHINEIETAKWLIRTFGGDVVLLNEKNLDNIKTPDFLWHNRYWDLKDVSSEKAIDNAVRKGLRQIQNNPGGLILDFGGNPINLTKAKEAIEGRLRRGFPRSVDFIVIFQNTMVVYRYKK